MGVASWGLAREVIVSSFTSNSSISSETKSQQQWKLQGRKEQGFIVQSSNGIFPLQGVSRLAWEAIIRDLAWGLEAAHLSGCLG